MDHLKYKEATAAGIDTVDYLEAIIRQAAIAPTALLLSRAAAGRRLLELLGHMGSGLLNYDEENVADELAQIIMQILWTLDDGGSPRGTHMYWSDECVKLYVGHEDHLHPSLGEKWGSADVIDWLAPGLEEWPDD